MSWYKSKEVLGFNLNKVESANLVVLFKPQSNHIRIANPNKLQFKRNKEIGRAKLNKKFNETGLCHFCKKAANYK